MSDDRCEFNKAAIFSDGTTAYCSPMEPAPFDVVTIRIRIARNDAEEVRVLSTHSEKRMQLCMQLSHSTQMFDYYEATIQLSDEPFSYFFALQSGKRILFYDRAGVTDMIREEYRFCLFPGFTTPNWAKGAVFYQIFVDRFCNGDASNDVQDYEYVYINEGVTRVTDWKRYPATMGMREFYGGDLRGVMYKLDYLKELGIEVIYLNPIFVSPSNHKYDIQDYDYIDPHFGQIVADEGELLSNNNQFNREASRYIKRVTDIRNLEASNQLMIRLVEEIHKRGMRVILDGVFNHCGSFNKWIDRERIYENQHGYDAGAFVSESSPYHDYFRFSGGTWPYNANYEGWWGHDTLPKLDYEDSQQLVEYMLTVAKKWVSPPYNVDGWRLDVAADLGRSEDYNHHFWRAFRDAVKEANPEALILAEHYGNPASWLNGHEWDSVMNYDAFMEPVTWFLTGVEKHSDEYRGDLLSNQGAFIDAMTHHMSQMPMQSLLTAMNELSNHDHSRFLTRTNHKVGRTATLGPEMAGADINPAIMREAILIQMTWPGAPTIYYGDEAGVCGWTDPDNRRTYPWGNEDTDMIAVYKEAIRIHRAYRCLKTGSIKFLCGQQGVISYARFNETDCFIIIVNNNTHDISLDVPVWQAGIEDRIPLIRMIYTDTVGFGVEGKIVWPKDGKLSLSMPPFSATVYKNIPQFMFSAESVTN